MRKTTLLLVTITTLLLASGGLCIPKGAIEVTPDTVVSATAQTDVASPKAAAQDANATSSQAVISTVRQATEQQRAYVKDVEQAVINYGIPKSVQITVVVAGAVVFMFIVLILIYQLRQMALLRGR